MRKILLIEDDPTLLKILQARLAQEGETEITIAIEPEEGFRKAESDEPNLIILDVFFPQSSGLEILKRLKENDKTRAIPVIVFSVAGREDIVAEALALGAARYIIKGMVPIEELVNIINDVSNVRAPGT